MIHQRKRLPLRFETRNNLFRVHPRFQDFQSDLTLHGLDLQCMVDDSERPLTEPLHQVKWPYPIRDPFFGLTVLLANRVSATQEGQSIAVPCVTEGRPHWGQFNLLFSGEDGIFFST